MKRILALTLFALGGCGNGTTVSPYLLSATVVDPIDPFVVEVSWEPSAGHVDAYTVEGRALGGSFTDLPFERLFGLHPGSSAVDLKRIVPNGGPVELRVRADPGGFESNALSYDPGPAISTVRVGHAPDPSAHAFVVSYGNRSAPQVLLLRRVVQTDGAAGQYVQVAAGSRGPENTYSDTDLFAWTDGALYEYQALSSAAGALPSRSAVTNRALLLAPEIISYSPGPTGPVMVVRNNSAHATSLSLTLGPPAGFLRDSLYQVAPPKGGTVRFVDVYTGTRYIDTHYSYYELVASANYGLQPAAQSELIPLWVAEQSPAAPLQPVTRTMQYGTSAARDAAGNFCIVKPIISSQGTLTATVLFPPGGDPSSALVVPASPSAAYFRVRLKCRIDSTSRSHTFYFLPGTSGSPGSVTHAWHDGSAWQTELIATRTTVSANGRTLDEDSIAFDIGVDGTLFAAWYRDSQTIEIASKTLAQAWILQTAPTSPYSGRLAISGDETGTPHLVSAATSANYHLFKGTSGWSAERIPPLQNSDSNQVEMSVAGGTVSYVSDGLDFNAHVNFVRGNSGGWSVADLQLGGVSDMAHSTDGREFIVVNNLAELAAIVRDGVPTTTPVAGYNLVKSAGFSANGKAWVLEWAPQPTDPAHAPAFLFEER